MNTTEILFARMEVNRRRGVGIRLSNDDLQLLSVSFLGETMQDCYEEAIEPTPTQPPEAQADAPRTQDAGGDDGR